MKKILLLVCLFASVGAYSAVPILEKLPQKPVDTLSTQDADVQVVLYSNNTWKYIHPKLDERLDTVSLFHEHWDNTQVFAYRSIELKDLPDVIDLKLIDSLSQFHCPLQGRVQSKYGPRGRRNHNGIDIPLKTGEPIYSAFEGKVRYAQYNWGGFGYLVIVRHANGLETWHAHLSRINVTKNSYVKAGEIIGYGGSTGRSTGPHLHFEMRYCDQTFDPEFLIDFESGQLRYMTFQLEKSFFNIHSRASDQLDEPDAFYDDLSDDKVNSDKILDHIAKAQTGASATLKQGSATFYTVRPGDSLIKIARAHGISLTYLCKINNIKTTSIIRIGQRLRVR